ncbi:MAG: vanadium-dependent haloperoxidase [Burkholderiales bacterium]
MKTFMSVTAFLSITAMAPAIAADSSKMAQADASTTPSWNRIALEVVERAKPNQLQAIRLMTYVSLAQYAALTGQGPSDASATASMQVIAGLIPAQAAFVEERYRQHLPSANQAEHPVSQRILAAAHDDRFAQPWTGQPPQMPSTWRSLVNPPAPPALPGLGAMRTFLIDSGSTFRAAPPPAEDSAQFRDDLAEVRRHSASPTEESTRLAKFYDMSTGTMVAGFWNERATELLRKNTIAELQAARILATVNTAMMDAAIACHDTKYTYWVPRPSQADPSIKSLIGVPNHPAYPSNHSCISTAAALSLAHFFPQDRARLEGIATEAGISRIYAGLHYRFDVDAGTEIGRKVASVAIARHDGMLARWTQTVVSKN